MIYAFWNKRFTTEACQHLFKNLSFQHEHICFSEISLLIQSKDITDIIVYKV